MKIRINGADADIRLETEKTVGEILSALESWLEGTGHRLSGLGIDGSAIAADSIEVCFGTEVDSIGVLDIYTSPIADLLAECLLRVAESIDEYEAAGFDERSSFAVRWKDSPEAGLLFEQSPDLFGRITRAFSGEGFGPQALRAVVEERLRELKDPVGEFEAVGAAIADVCARLEELPLDIQTGKDAKAAETVGVFAAVTEKVLRVLDVLKTSGFPVREITIGGVPISDYVTGEFHSTLRDLLNAYEQNDTVLVGDIAEYEVAPRLRGLHSAVLDSVKGTRQ